MRSLALFHALAADGERVEHIILLGLRGTSDQHIRERLFDRGVLFLTNDEDFLFDKPTEATVLVSRVYQSRRLSERVDVWRRAVLDLTRNPRPERRFELMNDGSLLAWEQGPGRTWIAKPPKGEKTRPGTDSRA